MNNLHKIARQMASQEKQSGQAIVLIAMLMIILLASLGLAIDGGGMFLLWRDAQNAADAAAIQAAHAYCTSGDKLSSAVTAGYEAADDNGFDDNQTDNWVIVGRAQTIDPSTVPSNAPNPNSVILVDIVAAKPAFFIQLVYGGPLTVHTRAVGACTSGGSIYDGYSIFTMGSNEACGYTDSDDAVAPAVDSATGSAPLDLSGSDTNWYSPLYSNGNVSVTGAGSDAIDGGGLELVGGINGSSNIGDGSGGSMDPPPSDTDTPINSFPDLYNINDFAPNDFTGSGDGEYWAAAEVFEAEYNANNNPNKDFTHYDNNGSNQPIQTVAEGLYFYNGDITFGQNSSVGSYGVTVVATGTINVATDAGQVWRPFVVNGTTLPLFYTTYDYEVDGNGQCQSADGIKIQGSQILAFGIIYAPRAGVEWSGSKVVYCGSMISWMYTSSASGMHLFGDKLPDLATLDGYGIVDDFPQIDWSTYAGLSCDYIDSAPPSFFLGDA